MKKNIVLSIILVTAVGLFAAFGILMKENDFNPEYTFGVIETSQSKRKTFITYYDDKGEVVNKQDIPYAEACDMEYGLFSRQEDHIYFAPTDGDWEGKNDVVDLCMDNGEIRLYKDLPDELDLDKYIASDSRRIYVNSNLNFSSYLYSMSLDGKRENYVKEAEECFGKMVSDGENLYVFNSNGDDDARKLYIYRCEDLKKVQEVELDKDYGTNPILVDGKVYFETSDREEGRHVYLGCYDIKREKESYIDLGEADDARYYVYSNLLRRGNRLCFVVSAEECRSRLFVCDLTTGEVYNRQMKESNIQQLEQKDEDIYALSFDNEKEEGFLYRYVWNEDGFEKKKIYDIYSKKGERDTYYYPAGFFVK